MNKKTTAPGANNGKMRKSILRTTVLLAFMALFATATFVVGDYLRSGNYDYSHYDTVPPTDRQTDRQTRPPDRQMGIITMYGLTQIT